MSRKTVKKPSKKVENFKEHTLFTGDNLAVLRGMNSNSVDLIYLDPPFNSNAIYERPIGPSGSKKKEEGVSAVFSDIWELNEVDVAWMNQCKGKNNRLYHALKASISHGKNMQSYLINMAVRLIEMKRILKDTGSICLHCDPTASHYLKQIMDCIFGHENFRNEIVWHYHGNAGAKHRFSAKHDLIFLYAKDCVNEKVVFNIQRVPYPKEHLKRFKEVDTDGRRFYWNGSTKAGRYKTYMKDGKAVGDTWVDIQNLTGGKEPTGYPTQKPLALLYRIIKACSNKGDLVLDPFCGCATTMVAAEQLDRKWVGIDLSPIAISQVQERMEKETNLYDKYDPNFEFEAPARTDGGKPTKDAFSEWKIYVDKNTQKVKLYIKQNGKCNGCRHEFPCRNLTIDHIKATSKGGRDIMANKQLLCHVCNSMKGSKSMETLIKKLNELGIRKKPARAKVKA